MKLKKYDIVLRPIKKSDITERYLSWFSDKTVNKFLEINNLTKNEVLNYIKTGINNKSYFMFAVCIEDTGLHIGNIKIGPIKHKYYVTDLVTVIGDKDYWGKGIASCAIKKAIEIAFDTFGLRKVSASIDSLNIGSLKSYVNAGMKVQANIPNYFMHNNNIFSDKIFVGCDNNKFKVKNFNLEIMVNTFETY